MIKEIKNELNYSFTENGAKVYNTTGAELLDLNFQVASLRGKGLSDVVDVIKPAFSENPELFYQWIFYLRNCRGGVGERETFRHILRWLYQNDEERVLKVLDLVPVYGRWDDLIYTMPFMNERVKNYIINLIQKQLKSDLAGMEKKEPISILAKWMPSINAGKKGRAFALFFIKQLGMTKKEYRKTLSTLRAYLDVVEIKMCAGEWSKIDYSKVPSRAGLLHVGAFRKHDEERYDEFIDQVKSGEKTINASVLFPYEIYGKCELAEDEKEIDTYNEAWKALPNYVSPDQNTIVVVDGSGSMMSVISGTHTSCLDVARSLGIYFSERNTSKEYKDKFITFSSRPRLVNLSKCKTLSEKINKMSMYRDCSNTDLKKVFKLILDSAVHNNLSQDQLPKNILIVSDMQFDCGIDCDNYLFDEIKAEYESKGYKVPKLIFWNVLNRLHSGIPVTKNENGVILVSGFSTAIAEMVCSVELDPWKALVKELDKYSVVKEKLMK